MFLKSCHKNNGLTFKPPLRFIALPCLAQPHTALLPLNFKNCQANECRVNLTVTYQFMPIQGPAKGCSLIFILASITLASVFVAILPKVNAYLAHSFLNLVDHMI